MKKNDTDANFLNMFWKRSVVAINLSQIATTVVTVKLIITLRTSGPGQLLRD